MHYRGPRYKTWCGLTRARAYAQSHLVRLLPSEQPQLLQSLLHGHTGIVSHHASEGAAVTGDPSVLGEHDGELELVPLAAEIVVGIVGWGHFHRTSTEAHIHQLTIRDDRDPLAGQEGVH